MSMPSETTSLPPTAAAPPGADPSAGPPASIAQPQASWRVMKACGLPWPKSFETPQPTKEEQEEYEREHYCTLKFIGMINESPINGWPTLFYYIATPRTNSGKKVAVPTSWWSASVHETLRGMDVLTQFLKENETSDFEDLEHPLGADADLADMEETTAAPAAPPAAAPAAALTSAAPAVVAKPGKNTRENAQALRLTQFNQLRVSRNKGGARVWHGKYSNDIQEWVSAQWVKDNFKPYMLTRCETHFGVWCYVPIGKNETSATGLEAGLKGCVLAGTDPSTTPEVRFPSGAGEDFCLAYGAASAVHHLGDPKLTQLLVEKASAIEQMERQMEHVRDQAQSVGWRAPAIKSVHNEEVAAFDPLTACPDGSALVMHIKETDGSADHAVAIARGFIFDANRTHALPLTAASLEVLQYDGIVSATLLTPSPKIAKALKRKRAAA